MPFSTKNVGADWWSDKPGFDHHYHQDTPPDQIVPKRDDQWGKDRYGDDHDGVRVHNAAEQQIRANERHDDGQRSELQRNDENRAAGRRRRLQQGSWRRLAPRSAARRSLRWSAPFRRPPARTCCPKAARLTMQQERKAGTDRCGLCSRLKFRHKCPRSPPGKGPRCSSSRHRRSALRSGSPAPLRALPRAPAAHRAQSRACRAGSPRQPAAKPQ